MKLDTSTIMMIFFIFSLLVSLWKIYPFLRMKQLKDDDTTQEAQKQLKELMIKVIKKKHGNTTEDELFIAMQEDEAFNSKLFWRFNLNKLKQLLNSHYIKNSNINNIQDIYKQLV